MTAPPYILVPKIVKPERDQRFIDFFLQFRTEYEEHISMSEIFVCQCYGLHIEKKELH